jgi:hypothetical protein
MERSGEEATAEESTRGGPRKVRWAGAQRGQEASQPAEWPQGRYGQKPQKSHSSAAQRPAASARTPEEKVRAAITLIRARFGECAIGLGCGGIRYAAPELKPGLCG